MGDFINNYEIFKRLGFDSSNQWIFYDEHFQKFFEFFADHITDANILTEMEVLERDELKERNEFLEGAELRAQLDAIDQYYPGLLQSSEQQVKALIQEIDLLTQTEESYSALVDDMRQTKAKINCKINRLEDEMNELVNAEKLTLEACQTKAKQLEELQRENSKLYNEATKCYMKMQSPPLFLHQMSLDQYYLKCDSFLQHFNLYIKENFKIQDYIELETSHDDMPDITGKLEELGESIRYYTLECIQEKAKTRATHALIERLDLSLIHIMSVSDMERETHELQLVNDHHLMTTYDTLMHDLNMNVQQHTQQHIELVLYENTKQKLQRALKRHDSVKHLARIISDAISNAELVWILIQLDLERGRNRCDNTEELNQATEACLRRIRTMQTMSNAAAADGGGGDAFVVGVTELLAQHAIVAGGNTNSANSVVRPEAKACLYEYEKFCRLLSYAEQNMFNKKFYTTALEQLNELDRITQLLLPYVYDGPVRVPLFEHVRLLEPIFNAKLQQQNIERTLRQLRTQYQENITERMEKDKLWRYSQLLWIWFLTEPKRVLNAIEKVKSAASKTPALAGLKALGGIKRLDN